ncbi:MAG: hypothetical protein LBT38_05950 [Deltaproteobacteria bacterium]|jgi:hypothetical protein|nr:hypothetical protein [Deltaproteobacteria bacterium]
MWWRKPYVSKAQLTAKAHRLVQNINKLSKHIIPSRLSGRIISESFWIEHWRALQGEQTSVGDYRLNSFDSHSFDGLLRDHAVCHLEVSPGRVYSLVKDSELYEVVLSVAPLSQAEWANLIKFYRRTPSLIDIMDGPLTDEMMTALSDPVTGLFPLAGEITFSCSCPDWAGLCRHVALVFYELAGRLNASPELLFKLRSVDPNEIFGSGEGRLRESRPLEESRPTENPALLEGDLEAIFGVEMDTLDLPEAPAPFLDPDSPFTLIPAPGVQIADFKMGLSLEDPKSGHKEIFIDKSVSSALDQNKTYESRFNDRSDRQAEALIKIAERALKRDKRLAKSVEILKENNIKNKKIKQTKIISVKDVDFRKIAKRLKPIPVKETLPVSPEARSPQSTLEPSSPRTTPEARSPQSTPEARSPRSTIGAFQLTQVGRRNFVDSLAQSPNKKVKAGQDEVKAGVKAEVKAEVKEAVKEAREDFQKKPAREAAANSPEKKRGGPKNVYFDRVMERAMEIIMSQDKKSPKPKD